MILIPSTELTADDAHAFGIYGLHIEAVKETVVFPVRPRNGLARNAFFSGDIFSGQKACQGGRNMLE